MAAVCCVEDLKVGHEFYVTLVSYINMGPHSHSNTTAKHSRVSLSYFILLNTFFLDILSPFTNIASHELFLPVLCTCYVRC